jgi:hypothetical protein
MGDCMIKKNYYLVTFRFISSKLMNFSGKLIAPEKAIVWCFSENQCARIIKLDTARDIIIYEIKMLNPDTVTDEEVDYV